MYEHYFISKKYSTEIIARVVTLSYKKELVHRRNACSTTGSSYATVLFTVRTKNIVKRGHNVSSISADQMPSFLCFHFENRTETAIPCESRVSMTASKTEKCDTRITVLLICRALNARNTIPE